VLNRGRLRDVTFKTNLQICPSSSRLYPPPKRAPSKQLRAAEQKKKKKKRAPSKQLRAAEEHHQSEKITS